MDLTFFVIFPLIVFILVVYSHLLVSIQQAITTLRHTVNENKETRCSRRFRIDRIRGTQFTCCTGTKVQILTERAGLCPAPTGGGHGHR